MTLNRSFDLLWPVCSPSCASFCSGASLIAKAASPSPLFARGYTVIPEPQKVELSGGDFAFGNGWRAGAGRVEFSATRAAVEVLRDELASRYGIHLETASKSGSVSQAHSDGDQPWLGEDRFGYGPRSRQVG